MSTTIINILISGLIGTTAMTLFTIFVETVTGKDLGEPKYLNRLISTSVHFDAKIGDNHIFGWAAHYVIGVLFAAVMVAFRSISGIHLTTLNGMLLGTALGIMGIIGWTVMFAVHHDPPKIDFPLFMAQLIVAHILFGATIAFYYR
ncbi:hypothetical protein [Pricia sp.]|uniref:hypothetical protein n=1 Tax=Pricia sp. TaxID=2268138 RepID=UPI003593FCEC